MVEGDVIGLVRLSRQAAQHHSHNTADSASEGQTKSKTDAVQSVSYYENYRPPCREACGYGRHKAHCFGTVGEAKVD